MGAHFGQGFRHLLTANLRMKTMLLFSLLVAAAFAAPDARFSCSECVDEMHKLGWMVKMGLCQSMTTLLLTTAQPLGKTKVGVRTPCPDTTLACCLLLLSTTLWTEPSMFARLEVLVTLSRSTLATSASRALSGSRLTLKTRS